MKSIAIAAMLLLPCAATAQVYKCKGSSGETVYSQNPCARDSKPHDVRAGRAATATPAEAANRQSVFKSTDISDAGIAERNCLVSARKRIYGPSDQRIAGYERQVQNLNREASLARNNLAGATYDAGIRNQLSGLQQSITAERVSADSQMSTATQQCAETKRKQVEAIEARYTPAANQTN
ncbi:DUF4124 domain-containing protein [Stenotrophomonas sp.]|uniref:DUF4124 domain-containing protein n=1 Tax=Stenotrophomonas sp. TaxID=69392 RepID=UPI00333F7531